MRTILVVEDNPVNLELITTMLEASDFHVVQARDGMEALELLPSTSPDLILLDLQMPRLDGKETLKCIRENPQWEKLPVIACTAYAMQGDRESLLASGFDGYVSKPLSMRSLMQAISAVSD